MRILITLLITGCIIAGCSMPKKAPPYPAELDIEGLNYLGSSDIYFSGEQDVNLVPFHPYSKGCGLNNDVKFGSYGIDISHHNSSIDWKSMLTDSLPERISHVIIKATEGVGYSDPLYQQNYTKAGVHGLKRGAYHFYLQRKDPILQANNFLKTAKLQPGDLFPVLDIEPNCTSQDCPDLRIPKADLLKNIGLFIKRVEDSLKCKVIIYTGDNFFKTYLAGSFKSNPFWIARYHTQCPSCFHLLDENGTGNSCGITDVRMGWQFTQSGKINGIKGFTDFNIFSDYWLAKNTLR